MAIVAICPSCGAAVELTDLRVTACARCRSPLPDALLSTAAVALNAPARPRPRALAFGMVLAGFGALVGVLIGVMSFVGGEGSYSVNGRPVSRAEFLMAAAPILLTVVPACAAVAWALWTERHWAREVIMGGAVLIAGGMLGTVLADVSTRAQWPAFAVMSAFYVGLPAWYLYARQSVREYFRTLKARARAGTA